MNVGASFKITEVKHAWAMKSIEHYLRVINGEEEEHVQVNPDDTVLCAVESATMTIEMPLDAAKCITIREFVEKYGSQKVFSLLQCNDYWKEGKTHHHIVLF